MKNDNRKGNIVFHEDFLKNRKHFLIRASIVGI